MKNIKTQKLIIVENIERASENELQLYKGWNLIGLPCMPEDTSIEVVLADILDDVLVVYKFDGETTAWSLYLPGIPSGLSEMVNDLGYWICMDTDATLTVNGS